MIRLIDFFLSLVGLLALSPVVFVLLIAGWLDTRSPLFLQKRVGKSQKTFLLVKFRTMRPQTASVATHLVDPASVTPLGHFLRRSKLDELPQLLNVLRGDMSLVGPRPCLPSQIDLIAERKSRKVFDVLPGITGAAQIQGIDMSNPKRLAEVDAEMIKNFDLKRYGQLVLLTIIGKGGGDRIAKG